jgi:hypothetical protein
VARRLLITGNNYSRAAHSRSQRDRHDFFAQIAINCTTTREWLSPPERLAALFFSLPSGLDKVKVISEPSTGRESECDDVYSYVCNCGVISQ